MHYAYGRRPEKPLTDLLLFLRNFDCVLTILFSRPPSGTLPPQHPGLHTQDVRNTRARDEWRRYYSRGRSRHLRRHVLQHVLRARSHQVPTNQGRRWRIGHARWYLSPRRQISLDALVPSIPCSALCSSSYWPFVIGAHASRWVICECGERCEGRWCWGSGG